MVFEMVYDIWKFSPESSTDSAVVHVMRAGRFLAPTWCFHAGGAAPRPVVVRWRRPYAEFHCTWFCMLRAVVFQIAAAASPEVVVQLLGQRLPPQRLTFMHLRRIPLYLDLYAACCACALRLSQRPMMCSMHHRPLPSPPSPPACNRDLLSSRNQHHAR